jgi:hypothetical protein
MVSMQKVGSNQAFLVFLQANGDSNTLHNIAGVFSGDLSGIPEGLWYQIFFELNNCVDFDARMASSCPQVEAARTILRFPSSCACCSEVSAPFFQPYNLRPQCVLVKRRMPHNGHYSSESHSPHGTKED